MTNKNNECKCPCHVQSPEFSHCYLCVKDHTPTESKGEWEFRFVERFGFLKQDNEFVTGEVILFIRNLLTSEREAMIAKIDERLCQLGNTTNPLEAKQSIERLIFGSNPPKRDPQLLMTLGQVIELNAIRKSLTNK